MTNVTEKINSQHDNLIEVIEAEIGGIKQQVVDARNLHTYLEVGRDFTTWIKQRLVKYVFQENFDYSLTLTKTGERLNVIQNDYLLTLDTAKELSMVENNEKGREARRYFIRCEKMAYEAMKSQFLLEPQTLVKKTTKDKRTALHEAIALLMTKSKYLHFKDCYKIIHQRFNVEHLDEIPEKKLPEAVEYVHRLITGSQSPNFESHAHNTALHMLWVSRWWYCYQDAIQLLNPQMAGEIHGHFMDGAFSASLTLGGNRTKELDARIQRDYPYKLGHHDLIDFFRRK
ncbi:antA/AntB antirepressor family protein [Acinetobacter ursingii]|uniref:antA/AntB antirepressor family protein n=1 Tax=Acinetobacter ursingii TaxID=108980 RepID=UPI003AF4796C